MRIIIYYFYILNKTPLNRKEYSALCEKTSFAINSVDINVTPAATRFPLPSPRRSFCASRHTKHAPNKSNRNAEVKTTRERCPKKKKISSIEKGAKEVYVPETRTMPPRAARSRGISRCPRLTRRKFTLFSKLVRFSLGWYGARFFGGIARCLPRLSSQVKVTFLSFLQLFNDDSSVTNSKE